MAQRTIYNNRGPELVANREHRLSTRRRAAAQAFGLYLPLLSDIQTPLRHAIKDATGMMDRTRRGPHGGLAPNDNFGMTFAQKNMVTRNMRNMLGQGFIIKHLIEHLQDSPVAVGAAFIEVPVAGFDWKGRGSRKLAAQFDTESLAYGALLEQAVEIGTILDEERGTNNMEIAIPDHVTVATYGHPGDGMSLSRRHRQEVAERFMGIFVEHSGADPVAMRLGSLVVGSHYNQPFDGLELVPEIPPFTLELGAGLPEMNFELEYVS